ncbi:MAG: helix-turn-helix domain-containing protein [Prolixibacteraceae bacterium]|nr:helix-turn-helix domain-containing protein [Prolixibacteraceae bacterium]
MKVANVRLLQEPDKSFIYYIENNSFTLWHHHPEIELCLITKGEGKRMVGDNIDRFEDNDLTLMGIDTPHEFLCDPKYFNMAGGFSGEGIVIQFLYDFLGEEFFKIPENRNLNNFILGAERGYCFFGETKQKIISIMLKMKDMNEVERLFSLFSIFKIFAVTKEYKVLSSPAFGHPFWQDGTGAMQKALKFILQNFQKHIGINDLLQVTNMSNTAFYAAFKNTYRMTFKEYLLNIRIGYACKLLTDPAQNISSIAYESGFENISNFNRQFKKIKGITPSEFVLQIKDMEVSDND